MRIKFDGELFSQKDMQELVGTLNAYGVSFEPVPKNACDRKGLSEIQDAGTWIAVLANAFLPILIQALYDLFKKRGKSNRVGGVVDINIERRSASECQSISFSLDGDISGIDLWAKQDGELRVFIKKAAEDTPSQQ